MNLFSYFSTLTAILPGEGSEGFSWKTAAALVAGALLVFIMYKISTRPEKSEEPEVDEVPAAPISASLPKEEAAHEELAVSEEDNGAVLAAITAAITAAMAEDGVVSGFRVVSFKRSPAIHRRNRI